MTLKDAEKLADTYGSVEIESSQGSYKISIGDSSE